MMKRSMLALFMCIDLQAATLEVFTIYKKQRNRRKCSIYIKILDLLSVDPAKENMGTKVFVNQDLIVGGLANQLVKQIK